MEPGRLAVLGGAGRARAALGGAGRARAQAPGHGQPGGERGDDSSGAAHVDLLEVDVDGRHASRRRSRQAASPSTIAV